MSISAAKWKSRPTKHWRVRDTQSNTVDAYTGLSRDNVLWALALRCQISYQMAADRFRVAPMKGNHAHG